MQTPEIRNAETSEIDRLAGIWHAGWWDAHAGILPAELARHRTLESFTERLRALLPATRVAGPPGEPVGFCITKGDELYQLYVSAAARGKGVAQQLIADAEERIADAGAESAWLACAIGNERAARFYERSGWARAGTFNSQLETPDGIFELEVWRYEKALVRYRRADLAQMKELLNVFAEVFDEPRTYRSAVPPDEYLESLLGDENFIPLVAVAEGTVVGGLAAYVLRKFEQQRSEIYIYDLGVLEPHRRRRIATGLINKLRSIAREAGAWVIFVQADRGDDPAIKLYESLGTREDVHHFDIMP